MTERVICSCGTPATSGVVHRTDAPCSTWERAGQPLDNEHGWRCTSTNPTTDRQCWLPSNHKGQDATNNWNLHQSENGEQW